MSAVGAAAVLLYRFVSLGLQSVVGAIAASTLAPLLQRHHDEPERDARLRGGAG